MIFFARDPALQAFAELQKEGFGVAAPFSTVRQALWFGALILGVVCSPIITQLLPKLAPEMIYKGVPLSYGNYYTIGHEVAKGQDIDVLILGASDGWTGIDPDTLAKGLSDSLGKPVRVLNFSTNWAGEERIAQILTDMKGRVRVKVVVGIENDALQISPHQLAKFWWRGSSGTNGLSIRSQMQMHFMQVLGLPRQLWIRLFLRPDRQMTAVYKSYTAEMIGRHGFNGGGNGWLSHSAKDGTERRALPSQEPPQPTLDPATFVFSGESDTQFSIKPNLYSPLQTYFFRQVNAIVKAQGGTYITIALPTHFRDNALQSVMIRPMSDGKPREWPVLGISQSALFPGYTFDEMKNFYSNESHFNKIGARAFTRAILPAIKAIYEKSSAH
jgi:hypothetical protein